MRLQLALNVPDLDAAVAFYEKMFDTPVHKRKPGYANFEVAMPPLKLVLFEEPGADAPLNHLGIEVLAEGEVGAAAERLKAAGLTQQVQDETTCCYAKADKVWTTAPDGLAWEWYRVLEDSETFDGEPEKAEAPEPEPEPFGCC